MTSMDAQLSPRLALTFTLYQQIVRANQFLSIGGRAHNNQMLFNTLIAASESNELFLVCLSD